MVRTTISEPINCVTRAPSLRLFCSSGGPFVSGKREHLGKGLDEDAARRCPQCSPKKALSGLCSPPLHAPRCTRPRRCGSSTHAWPGCSEGEHNATFSPLHRGDWVATASIGRSWVVPWIRTSAMVTLHSVSCSCRSTSSTKVRPGRKLPLKYFTPDSTLPLVWARYGWQTRGSKLQYSAKALKVAFQTIRPSVVPRHTVRGRS